MIFSIFKIIFVVQQTSPANCSVINVQHAASECAQYDFHSLMKLEEAREGKQAKLKISSNQFVIDNAFAFAFLPLNSPAAAVRLLENNKIYYNADNKRMLPPLHPSPIQ